MIITRMVARWVLATGLAASAIAQDNPQTNPSPDHPRKAIKQLEDTQTIATNSTVRPLDADRFQIGPGLVTFNKKAGTVSFPASINMNTNLIEFVIDAGNSKLHECLLSTDAAPFQIHLASLLISAPGQLPATQSIHVVGGVTGAPVNIEVSWEINGKKQSFPIEQLITKADRAGKRTPLKPGSFIYTSSRQHDHMFVAQATGIVVALLEDASSLINSSDPDRTNDELFFINHEICPPVGTPVQVTLSFPQKNDAKSEAKR